MFKAAQYRRLVSLAFLLIAAFCGLGYRLVDLQVLRHDSLQALADDNTKRVVIREPRRGDIRDIRGNILATSVFVKTVCADPTLIGPYAPQVARAIAPFLGMPETEVLQKLQPRLRINVQGQTVTNQYVVLKRKVHVEEWEQIRKAMASLDLGVDEQKVPKAQRPFYRGLHQKSITTDVVEDQLREYPNETLAAHILGFVGMTQCDFNGEKIEETSGRDGLELSLNEILTGVRGWRKTERDSRGRELVQLREQDVEPRPGANVVLTIDSGVQHIVETELVEIMKKHTPLNASIIVMRPRTGEIVAMATAPSFDPANPGASPAENRKNRCLTDISEPGSTFKIVVVSGALNEKIVTLQDRFDCEHGMFVYAGKALHDHESYGVLSVENIITKSSNIGSAKIGIKMGEPKLYQYIRDFGFGIRTGVPLPGEVNGWVHPLKDWNKLSISRIPMGHEVAVTRLQMITAMSAIANGGKLMRPMLVNRLEDADGRVVAKYDPQTIRQVVAPDTARQMVAALKTVVTADGTAVKAQMDHYTVAGKTGTAQKAGPSGYLPGKYFSSFIGFFPADNPELCISVVLDEPKQGYYGGQTAAPFFRNIAERSANYLNIRPDKDPVDPQFTGRTTAASVALAP